MADTCSINYSNEELSNELKKITANNKKLYVDVREEVRLGENDFKPEFLQWCEDNNKSYATPKALANSIIDYYFRDKGSVAHTSRLSSRIIDNVNLFGYTSAEAREISKRFFVTSILDIFNKNEKLEDEKKELTIKDYLSELQKLWTDKILLQIARLEAIPLDDVRSAYNSSKNKEQFLNDRLGNADVTSRNYIATYLELFPNSDTGYNPIVYINEIFRAKELQPIFDTVSDTLESEMEKANEILLDDVQAEDDIDIKDIDDADTTLLQLNNKIGMYSSFMQHLGPRLLNYFNTLRRRNSLNADDIATDEIYGLDTCMDANACITMLLNKADTSNLSNFIQSVRHIGLTVPTFEAFTIFANDLENNLDFATEVATTMFKMKVAKIVVQKRNDTVNIVISNEDTDERTVFLNDLFDDVKRITKDINVNIANNIFNKVKEYLQNRDIDRAKEQTVKLLQYLFPSIQKGAISAYITLKENVSNERTAIDNLITEAKKVIDKIGNVSAAYDNHVEQIEHLKRQGIVPSANDLTFDYANELSEHIIKLTQYLLPYSIVETSFNSRNIYGNNNSDIINPSFIMNLERMLEATTRDANGKIRNSLLEEWVKNKVENSNQYKYSNIFVETRDAKGNIINPGLCRYVAGQLQLTEYAIDALKVVYFNGTEDLDIGKSASYPDMTQGDFIPTEYLLYHKTNIERSERTGLPISKDKIDLRTFVCRIQSDAPKIFGIQAPRIKTDDLLILSDEDRLRNDSHEIARTVTKIIDRATWESQYANTTSAISDANHKAQDVSEEQLKRYIIPGTAIYVNTEKINSNTKAKETIVPIRYVSKNVSYMTLRVKRPDNKNYFIVLKGNRVNKKAPFIVEEIVGVVQGQKRGSYISNENPVVPQQIIDTVADAFYEKMQYEDVVIGEKTYAKASYKLDVNHNVFTILRRSFMQELLNACTALNSLFELHEIKEGTNRWVVRFKNGSPVLKKGNNYGITNYHLDKNGEVVTKVKGGYALNGNVFHSNKFSYIDANGVAHNPLDAIISMVPNDSKENVINFLYGGGIEIELSENRQDVVGFRFKEGKEDAINQAITDAINEFASGYIDEVNRKITENIEFLPDVNTNINAVADFAINSYIMHLNYDDLLEGESSFYKNAQDLLKRAKEVQGSGVAYGICDYTTVDVYNLNDVPNSYLNSDKFQSILTSKYLKGTRQRNGFKAVTIKNSKNTNEANNKILIKALTDAGQSYENAYDIIYGKIVIDKNGNPVKNKKTGEYERYGGFTDTVANDAQSYITVREWVRRVCARGQGIRYASLIKKLNNPNYVLSASEIKEFVQVQKNVYYDIYHDDEFNIDRPRFIKNAEFVLVPQLIKGTQLEQVLDLMEEAGIDQLNTKETSKASNKNILTLWDNDGNISAERLENFAQEARNVAEVFSYNYLYTQLENPQHMNSQNKAGIQIMKKIIDNLPNTGKLGELKTMFMDLYVANIEDSFGDLLRELGVPLNDDGNIDVEKIINDINLNNKLFYKKLEKELRRTGMDDNVAKFVTLNENGQAQMPAYLNNFINKFESLVQSVWQNAVTRQKLPGFHAPQVTNIGWSNMASDLSNLSKRKLESNRIFIEYSQWAAADNTFKDKTAPIIEWNGDNLTEEAKESFIKYINWKTPSYGKKLAYHPVNEKTGKSETYIEVVVPYSYLGIDKTSSHYKNMSDDEILEELRAQGDKGNFGLDEFIGYRIPTEGKQSMCRMKVVGFISDAYGSTIIVPDEWVAQTGSDFDVDSIYGIQYETIRTRSGQIKKVQYKESFEVYDWIDYLDDKIKDLSEEDIEIASSPKKVLKDIDKRLRDKEKEFIDKLRSNKWFTKLVNSLDDIESDQERRHSLIYSLTNKVIPKLSENPNNAALVNILQEIVNFESAYAAYVSKDTEELNSLQSGVFASIIVESTDALNKLAKDNNLKTLAEYKNISSKEDVMKANSRRARNSKLLETMQRILADDSTLEETLQRSQYQDLLAARTLVMPEQLAQQRQNRSSYNPIHQAMFQEEAMSGAKLKAVSVTLDTFCSICNVVRPKLTKEIKVIYKKSDIETNNPRYFEDYSTSPVGKDYVEVTFNKYGWSNSNRNIVGRLLTPYSSQTTAYILDAIKEGSMPNVNLFTFNVFKTLPNIGLDYVGALSFIMQPAVEKIIRNNNEKNSVFSTKNGNPIFNTIKDIARELGISVSATASIQSILEEVDDKYHGQFNKLFENYTNNDLDIDFNESTIANMPFVVDLNRQRIEGTGVFKNKENALLYDLAQTLIYHRINGIADSISSIARCSNPDKFGAKQTVFATRDVFRTIDECIFTQERVLVIEKSKDGVESSYYTSHKVPRKQNILDVNGKHILAAIYPGADTIVDDTMDIVKNIAKCNVNDSAHRVLCSFLKYSSCSSILMAQKVLETEEPQIIELINGLADMFSGYNAKLDEETFKDFRYYFLSTLYNEVSSIKNPVRVRKVDGNVVLNKEIRVDDKTYDLQDEDYILRRELERIYGICQSYRLEASITKYQLDDKGNPVKDNDGNKLYYTEDVPIIIKDINNATDEEMEIFEHLSPAQKVLFIQQHFTDKGIFGHLKVEFYSPWYNGQKIKYIEQSNNPNVIFKEFRDAFFNTNPLIVSAAIDLIKYSAIVEGFKMSSTAINKIIDFTPLINEFGEDGIGFIDELRESVANLKTSASKYYLPENVEELYEHYLRSHDSTKKLATLYFNQKLIDSENISLYNFGVINIFPSDTDTDETYALTLRRLGITTELQLSDNDKLNKYVKVIIRGVPRIYKIANPNGDLSDIYLYPLGKLNTFETSDFSVDDDNNSYVRVSGGNGKIVKPVVYDYLCTKLAELKKSNESISRHTTNELLEKWEEENSKNPYYQVSKKLEARTTVDFDINQEAAINPNMAAVLLTIQNYFENDNNDTMYDVFRPLLNYIMDSGIGNTSRQTIPIVNSDGTSTNINIKITKLTSKAANNRLQRTSEDSPLHPQLERIVQEVEKFKGKNVNQIAIYEVQKLDDEPMASSTMSTGYSFEESQTATTTAFDRVLIDVSDEVVKFMKSRRDGMDDDETARLLLGRLRNLGITPDSKITSNILSSVTKISAEYSRTLRNQIINELVDKFVLNPDGTGSYLTIYDPAVPDLLKTDAALRDKYIKTIRLIGAYNDVFSKYEMDFDSDDADIKRSILSIQKDLKDIKALPFDLLTRRYNETVVRDMSTNPLIKEDLIDIMENYWRASSGMWKFNDIMESGNPFLQTMLKEVMNNIAAKRLATERVVKEYNDKRKAIEESARKRGETINWDKIIDKNGRRIRVYDRSLVDKIQELRNAKKVTSVKGYHSTEWQRANLAYNKFVTEHFHQEAKKEYYIKKNALIENMLNNHSEIFEQYNKIHYRQLELLELRRKGIWRDENQNEYDDLNKQLLIIENEIIEEKNEDSVLGFVIKDNKEAKALNEYLDNLAKLNDKYFENKAVFGFYDKLNDVLNIIDKYEQPVDGIPTYTPSMLMDIPQYRDAYNWLLDNARFEVLNNAEGEKIQSFVSKALTKLKLRSPKIPDTIMGIFRNANDGRGIWDGKGIPDGTFVSDEDRALIKQAKLTQYKQNLGGKSSDRILISFAPQDKVVYRESFYEHIISRQQSQEYYDTVTEINSILEKYTTTTGGLDLLGTVKQGKDVKTAIPSENENLISQEEAIADFRKLQRLYIKLQELRESGNTSKEWLEENVEFKTDEDVEAHYRSIAEGNTDSGTYSSEFLGALKAIIYARTPNGTEKGAKLELKDKEGNVYRPMNTFLFSYMKPKSDDWIDEEATKAVNIIDRYFYTETTPYLAVARAQAIKEGRLAEFNRNNTVYNPYTRKLEYLPHWIKSKFNYNAFSPETMKEHWVPKNEQVERKVKTGVDESGILTGMDMRDPDYIDADNIYINYIPGSDNGTYDSKINLNKSEQEMLDLLDDTLMRTATVPKVRRFLEKGYMPMSAQHTGSTTKRILRESAKMIGINPSDQHPYGTWHKELGYSKDFVPDAPMITLLNNKQTYDYQKTLDEAVKELNDIDNRQFATTQEKQNRVKELNTVINDCKKHIDEERAALINRDWNKVMEEYLTSIGRYNAVMEEKDKLTYLLEEIRRQKAYSRQYGLSGNLKRKSGNIKDEGDDYEQTTDENLIQQLEVFYRRFVYDEWKKPEGYLTKMANAMQGFTSANYMMLNVKGGVANVTLGETGILAEAAANEYFGKKHWMFGTSEWQKGIIGFARTGFSVMHGDVKYYNKQAAIVGKFRVVDYDEKGGVVRDISLEEYTKNLRDMLFSPQNIGEHFMQNSVLFAMLESHKVVKMPDGKATYMNKQDYIRYKLTNALTNMLSEEQVKRLNEFKAEVKEDKDKLKEYAWFRKDILARFLRCHCSKEERHDFNELKKAKTKEFAKEFDELESIYKQLEFKDGELFYKDGSTLAELDTIKAYNNSDITEADRVLGALSEKVKKVNNKIHGAYNRDSAAYIEHKWYGSFAIS